MVGIAVGVQVGPPMGSAPPWPKLPLSRLKSEILTVSSALKSDRQLEVQTPNSFLSMLKSLILSTLSLLASPTLRRPISTLFVPSTRVALPPLARVSGFLTRRL